VPITQPGFATISPSPFANTGDPVTYNIDEVGDPALFAVLPTVSANGTLSYQLAAGASGSSPIAVSATQDGRTSIEQFFQINVVQDSTIEVTTTQPSGTVPAGQDEEYDVAVTTASTTNGIAVGTTVSVELDMPAGFDLDSIAGNGWTFSNYGPNTTVVFASYNVSSAVAVGGSLLAMAVYGSFQSATYNPYLTAIDNLAGSNQLNSNSNLVFTNLDDAVFNVGQTGSFQISANEAASLEQDSSTLPAGFTFNSATGTLTGTPTTNSGGTYSFSVSAIGQLGQIFAQTFTVTIDEPISTSIAGSLNFTEGQSGSYSITATGYPIPNGFFNLTGTLPTGLSYSSTTSGDTTTLSITGTPVVGSAGQYPLEELMPLSNESGISAEFVFVTLTVTAPNPAPTLSGITTSQAVYGANATTIKLNGTGFVAGSVAQWNGVALATTYISNTQLSALIPATDLLAAGDDAITVYSPGPGGGTSQAQTFTVARATPIVQLNITTAHLLRP
jgi:hypothetical protein